MAILILEVYKGFGPKLAAGDLSGKHEIHLGKAEASGYSTCLKAVAIVLGRVGAMGYQRSRLAGRPVMALINMLDDAAN